MKRTIVSLALVFMTMVMVAQEDSLSTQEMRGVDIVAVQSRHAEGIGWKENIGRAELVKLACCNLGESFQNSASVDVSYSEASTGVRQIMLLGLAGTYVQMMTENMPNFTGVALPYRLSYIPGPWMQSIQISKGAASVKNGYESMTGQINVELLKPQADDVIEANAYLDMDLKYDVNLGIMRHLKDDRWSTGLLFHWENSEMAMDGNKDGFMDKPLIRHINLMNRWAYVSSSYVMQTWISALWEKRRGGQMHDVPARYAMESETQRYELHTKHAYVFNREQNGSIAFMLGGSYHKQNNIYGASWWKRLDVEQYNLDAQLLYEQEYSAQHHFSAGANLSIISPRGRTTVPSASENFWDGCVPGIYAQYTWLPTDKLTLMLGARLDHDNRYGAFFTPRANLRWSPVENFTWRISAGKGYRRAYPLLEHSYMLATSRRIHIAPNLPMEEAWNVGTSMNGKFRLAGKNLEWSADYYYTHFLKQVVMDRDTDPHAVLFYALAGKSYSHALQFEVTYPLFRGFTATAAYRFTHVRQTIGQTLAEPPLTNRHKGLLSLEYKPGLGLWVFNVTCQYNGSMRVPSGLPEERGKSYPQLSAQVTRKFRHWDLYAGCENITNFKQENPIIDAHNPWGDKFDSSIIWGPVTGAMAYVGVRLNINE